MTIKQKSYEEVARLSECLLMATKISDDTCKKLYGVTKDEAIRNITKCIEKEVNG